MIAAATTHRDLDWLRRNIPDDAHCVVVDITSAWAVLGVMGPKSRELLGGVLDADLSTASFPFGASKPIELGYAVGRATRVSYVGELGWELHHPIERMAELYAAVQEAGAAVLPDEGAQARGQGHEHREGEGLDPGGHAVAGHDHDDHEQKHVGVRQ